MSAQPHPWRVWDGSCEMPQTRFIESRDRISFPVVDLPELFHVGTFDETHKGVTHNTTSLEGNGLSVSLHPEAWREIARLGQDPVWKLTTSHAAFIDALSLEPEHWKAVTAWAETHGLAQKTEVVRVSWYDDEDDDRRYFEFDMAKPDAMTRAQNEASEYEDCDVRIERFPSWSSTQQLNERIGFDVESSLVRDMILTLYVEDVLHPHANLQGVWWDEKLDPGMLSAPRGVIHTRALGTWQRQLNASPYADAETMEKAQAAHDFLDAVATPKAAPHA